MNEPMAVTDDDLQKARVLCGRIETAVGELPDRDGPNAALIAEILHAVNGLRSLLGVVVSH